MEHTCDRIFNVYIIETVHTRKNYIFSNFFGEERSYEIFILFIFEYALRNKSIIISEQRMQPNSIRLTRPNLWRDISLINATIQGGHLFLGWSFEIRTVSMRTILLKGKLNYYKWQRHLRHNQHYELTRIFNRAFQL